MYFIMCSTNRTVETVFGIFNQILCQAQRERERERERERVCVCVVFFFFTLRKVYVSRKVLRNMRGPRKE